MNGVDADAACAAPCPTCGAQPQEPCAGKAPGTFHIMRLREAAKTAMRPGASE